MGLWDTQWTDANARASFLPVGVQETFSFCFGVIRKGTWSPGAHSGHCRRACHGGTQAAGCVPAGTNPFHQSRSLPCLCDMLFVLLTFLISKDITWCAFGTLARGVDRGTQAETDWDRSVNQTRTLPCLLATWFVTSPVFSCKGTAPCAHLEHWREVPTMGHWDSEGSNAAARVHDARIVHGYGP